MSARPWRDGMSGGQGTAGQDGTSVRREVGGRERRAMDNELRAGRAVGGGQGRDKPGEGRGEQQGEQRDERLARKLGVGRDERLTRSRGTGQGGRDGQWTRSRGHGGQRARGSRRGRKELGVGRDERLTRNRGASGATSGEQDAVRQGGWRDQRRTRSCRARRGGRWTRSHGQDKATGKELRA